MPFSRPTLQQIVDRIESDYKTRIDNAESLLRRSFLRISARVYAGAIHLVYGFLQFIKDQLFATTADAENLEVIGSEFGVSRKAAIKATGEATAGGTVGVSIPSGSILRSNAGELYTTDSDVSIGIGGTADVEFTAVVAGSDSNDSAGVTLTFISPISGINTTMTVDSNGITGGVDEETDAALRSRILSRKRLPPHGGAEFDYENWALEVSGVTRAWSFPEYQGMGTVGLAFVRDNDSNTIIPNETQRAEVRSYIVSHTDPLTGKTVGIPVTAEPGFFMLPVTLKSLDFTIKVIPNNATVKSEIESKLEDLILAQGGPGETIYLSEITTAIASSATETAHVIVSPTQDITCATNEVPVLGTVTLQDY
jgi:uncharacterized phage protein gp47/JayE